MMEVGKIARATGHFPSGVSRAGYVGKQLLRVRSSQFY